MTLGCCTESLSASIPKLETRLPLCTMTKEKCRKELKPDCHETGGRTRQIQQMKPAESSSPIGAGARYASNMPYAIVEKCHQAIRPFELFSYVVNYT